MPCDASSDARPWLASIGARKRYRCRGLTAKGRCMRHVTGRSTLRMGSPLPPASTLAGLNTTHPPPSIRSTLSSVGKKSTHNIPKPASQALVRRMKLTLLATWRTPHGAARLVEAISVWPVHTRRVPCRHCRDARVLCSYDYGHA